MGTAGSTLSGDQLHRLVLVGHEIVSELDLPTVLGRVVETARELTGARYGALGVLNRSRDHLEQFLTSGIDETTHRAIGDLPPAAVCSGCSSRSRARSASPTSASTRGPTASRRATRR